ncbi:limbic system-associated membrane protein-like [Callorhinus ursinus]|uniref:limbic system-associated membrane protein-like n=1 Tax=Callorhinus ursinus TaxID=34884 RepID=UPI003CD01055
MTSNGPEDFQYLNDLDVRSQNRVKCALRTVTPSLIVSPSSILVLPRRLPGACGPGRRQPPFSRAGAARSWTPLGLDASTPNTPASIHLLPRKAKKTRGQDGGVLVHTGLQPKPSVDRGREFEGEEEYLEILGITREQSGKYECKAANEVSSADVRQVKVTVNYPPTITESKSNEATTGRKASLKCEASAVPAPDFEWYRDDTRINSANGLEIKSTEGQSSLTVTNVTEEHYGNYTCVAANNLGVTNASLVLFKRVSPTIPIPIQEIGTTVHFKQKGPGSVRGINGSISLAVPLWLLAASLLCLLSKC